MKGEHEDYYLRIGEHTMVRVDRELAQEMARLKRKRIKMRFAAALAEAIVWALVAAAAAYTLLRIVL